MISALLAAACIALVGARVRWASPPRRPQEAMSDRVTAPAGISDATHRRRSPRRQRTPDDPAAVAGWCDRLARAVRSGSTLSAAVRSEQPPELGADTLDGVVLALDRGVPLHDALALPARSPHVRLALTVLRACAANGGPAGEPLDRAAAILRARAADLAERRTQSAQARSSAVVMTVLPAAMLLLLVATSGSVRRELVTPIGSGVVVVGVALNLAGWRWMRRLIDGTAR